MEMEMEMEMATETEMAMEMAMEMEMEMAMATETEMATATATEMATETEISLGCRGTLASAVPIAQKGCTVSHSSSARGRRSSSARQPVRRNINPDFGA